MSKFKVGDRVAVYHGAARFICSVIATEPPSVVRVSCVEKTYEKIDSFYAHQKQCRKLVKKKRMEVWISFGPGDTITGLTKAPELFGSNPAEWIRFIEAREKK